MFDLGKLVFDHIFQLIIGVIDDKLKSSTLSYLEQRKIRRRVEDATAEVVESLVPFLQQEKISQDKQERLIETCVRELKPFTENPAELFKGSLDGQKIFENLYHDKELPQVIIEDDLRDTYSLLLPRIATLLCKIPAAVKDWESEAWSENYRRFDEVVAQLKALFAQVDELASSPQKGADATLIRFKQMLAQKVGLQLDITGLRADQPYSGKFDDFFVLPEIKQVTKENEKEKEPVSVTEPDNCFCTFTNSGCLSIVIGAPGAGKSTWSKWLQRETLRADWVGIGIRVEFRDLKADELPSIYELVRKVAGRQLAEDLTSEKIRKWLDNWRIAFILDGFDEVKPTDRARFVDWIKEISEFAKGCPFVITSRPLTTNHLEMFGHVWRQWIIEPFDKVRIITYISKWYDNSPLLTDSDREINAQQLAQGWLSDSTIGPLTGNPLLLSTLLMVHHLDGKLPNGRANLYKRYVDGMLGLWDDRHKLSATNIQLSPIEKRKIIRGIALHLFLTEKETIDENILVSWLEKFLPTISIRASSSEVLLILRERTGLIVGPGVYNFAHKTIAEFMVAETIIQGDQKDSFGKRIDRFHLFENRNDDRWNTVLFLWAGLASFIDVKSFIDECVNNKNWSLAFGLLLDQYDRFPKEIRKSLLLKTKTIPRKTNKNMGFTETSFGVASGSKRHPLSIAVNDLYLRGLTGHKSIFSLFQNAVRDNTINWKDFSNTKGYFYDLLWIVFVSSALELETWKAILNSPFPKKVLEVNINALIESWQFTLYGFNLDFIKVYLQIFPDRSGYIPICLMGNSIFWFSYDFRDSSFEHSQVVAKENLLKIIDYQLTVDPEIIGLFLSDTKEWKILTYDGNENVLDRDLLKMYKKFISKLVSEGTLDLDKIRLKNVKKWINKLVQIRDGLESSQ